MEVWKIPQRVSVAGKEVQVGCDHGGNFDQLLHHKDKSWAMNHQLFIPTPHLLNDLLELHNQAASIRPVVRSKPTLPRMRCRALCKSPLGSDTCLWW